MLSVTNSNYALTHRSQCTDGESLRLSYATQSSTGRLHLNRPWCWGVISRAECEEMLRKYSLPGEFIVRDCESHPGGLTVTINAGNKTRNFKVHVENGQYHIGQKVFACIDDLIEHYRTHPIFKNEHEKHYLTRPFIHPGIKSTIPFDNGNISTSNTISPIKSNNTTPSIAPASSSSSSAKCFLPVVVSGVGGGHSDGSSSTTYNQSISASHIHRFP
ncbi:unnamed protein product [Heterobilharzia americana]|nr:unnamed protein product [Heterobilharzia americana]